MLYTACSDELTFGGSGSCGRRVFLALALFNLGKADESEETYKKAVELSPTQPLARQVRSESAQCRQVPSAARQADTYSPAASFYN